MSESGIRKRSIIYRLFMVIALVSVIQVAIVGATIYQSDIINKIKYGRIDTVKSIVDDRMNEIENHMVKSWTDEDNFQYIIDSLYDLKWAEDLGVNVDEERFALIMYLLTNTMATGAYYVSSEDNSYIVEAIYLRDINPETYSISNSDILLEVGKASVAKTFEITMDSNWKAYGDIELLEADFVTRPIQAYDGNVAGDTLDYGCWTVGNSIYNVGEELLYYSVPLFDDQGSVYAVLGIDVSKEYMARYLKYDELPLGQESTYVLGIEVEDGVIEPVCVTGPMYRNIVAREEKIVLNEDADFDTLYNMKIEGEIEGEALIFKSDMALYNVNTPFDNEKWVVLAIQDKAELFESENSFKNMLIMGGVVVVICGLVGAYVASHTLARPIKRVYENIRGLNFSKRISIEKVGIKEIDHLTEAIELMGKEIAESASKVYKIIKDSGLQIGVIEINKKENSCIITSKALELMGINGFDEDYRQITVDEMEKILKTFYSIAGRFEGDREDDVLINNNTYEIICNGEKRWVAFKTTSEGDKNLVVINDVTDKIMEKLKLEYEVNHDDLSKLLNIRAFRNEVNKRLEKPRFAVAAMVMWDLDNLKYINDTYGHEYGDLYIKETARGLSSLEYMGAIVARRSGDEFFVFIEGENREILRKRLFTTHEELMKIELDFPENTKIKIRASAGIAWYPDDATDYIDLTKKSDFAMYSIKHNNKGRIGEFRADEYLRDEILISGNEELNKFIENKSLKMAFQPIVDGRTGEVFAYEALMRPKTEKLKTPYDVIRLAKSQSKLMEIEKITWYTALEEFFIEHNGKDESAMLFVNSFSNAVLNDEDADELAELFAPYFDRVITEITESEEMNDEFMRKKVRYAEGVKSNFALDDFGTGFNSEMKLIQLNPAYVKIDKGFIKNITEDKYRQEMLNNIVSYCNKYDIKIIAEGIEEEEELRFVIEAGVDYIQGFYLAKPVERLLTDQEKNIIEEKIKKCLHYLEE